MRADSCSDIGRYRKENQDSMGFFQFDENTIFAVVCDGLGGYSGGAIASKTATDYIIQNVRENYFKKMKLSSVERMIKTATENASLRIMADARQDPKNSQMCTTAVSVFIRDGEAIAFNVGDSRCYKLSGDTGALQLITKDHSLYQQYKDEHSEGAAKSNYDNTGVPDKKYITSCLGIENMFRLDSFSFNVNVGDTCLLCSDGLTNEVSDDDIRMILRAGSANKSAELIEEAKMNGGRDNITAIVISV